MNIIYINSDSFRRDNLSCYGGTHVHTPNIDKFAERSVIFDRAYTGSFPTVPNRRDVLTGKYTFTYAGWEAMAQTEITLPMVLKKAGYTSYMVQDTPHTVAWGFGFERGFSGWNWIRGQEGDRYKTDPLKVTLPCDVKKLRGGEFTTSQYLRNTSEWKGEEDYFAPTTMAEACKWLDKNHKHEKFYLYVDTFDPHEPWTPPQKYLDMYDPGYKGESVIYPLYAPCSFLTDPELAHCYASYCGEVTMVDAWVGKLLKKIEDLGLLENTLVVFTADHGFYFGEHGLVGKVPISYTEVNRIPLIMHMPGMKQGRRNQFVQPCDHMPTMLDLAGVEHPDFVQGKSLVDIIKGSDKPVRDFAVTSYGLNAPPASDQPITLSPSNFKEYSGKLRTSTIVTDDWTLIVAAGDLTPELYHNASDPHQHNNIFGEHKEVAKHIHAKYVEMLVSLGTDEQWIKPRRTLPGI